MLKGKIIKFFDHKGLISGMCLSEEGGHIHVLCEDGKQLRLSPGRVLHASADACDVLMPPGDLLTEIRRREARQNELMKQVSPGALWKEAGGNGRLFDLTALARAAFGEKASPDHEAAVLCALAADKIYFKLQGLHFFAYTPEQIQKQQLKIKKEQQRQELIREGAAWLTSVLEKREAYCANKNIYAELLKSFVTFGKESPYYSEYREMFSGAGIADQKQCFDILVMLGIWDEDENFLLQRYHIAHQWPREALEMVDRIGDQELRCAISDPIRKDLTQLKAFSIDDSFTRDIDDAISFELDKDVIHLGVHITDASAFVPKGSPLDQEAACRCTSIYLPEAKISMLPQALSENSGSLKEGEKRPAVSFLLTLSEAGDILDCRGALSVVRVKERLSYGEVDGLIQKGSDFTHLYNLACALRKKRIAAGATWFLTPELQVRVDRSREVTLKIRDKELYSQIVVSECMILANYCASLLFQEKQYPALYRKQAADSERMEPCASPTLLQILSRRKHFSRVVIDTQPGPHSSLGLASYTSITSPLRKYLDLVTQRQIVSCLKGEAPSYSRKDLKNIAAAAQPSLTKASLMEQERKRYWLLKVLKKKAGEKLHALVLEKKAGEYTILLLDYLYEASLKVQSGIFIAPGDAVSVIVEKADPFHGELKVQLS